MKLGGQAQTKILIKARREERMGWAHGSRLNLLEFYKSQVSKLQNLSKLIESIAKTSTPAFEDRLRFVWGFFEDRPENFKTCRIHCKNQYAGVWGSFESENLKTCRIHCKNQYTGIWGSFEDRLRIVVSTSELAESIAKTNTRAFEDRLRIVWGSFREPQNA